MKRVETIGEGDIGEHNVSRSMGLWSDDNSLRFSMWIGYGIRMRAISKISSLCFEFVGICVGEEGAEMK
jgi:hypothetical protein